jgi:catechol 2,3-dioxygenase-like lactoylglutathione lyase family enzyme
MSPTMNIIDIVVSDIDASMAFYRLLGLEFEIDAQMPGHAGCDLPGGLHLMLDTEKLAGMARSEWNRGAGSPPVYLAFQLPTPADVDGKYTELTAAGYRGEREPWDAFWGHRFATVLDPDGNGIDLYAPLATQ